MITIELPIFGTIQLESTSEAPPYENQKQTHLLNGAPLDLDVHFKQVDEVSVGLARQALNDISQIQQIGLAAIQKDFKEGEVVKDYIEEWNEDIFLQIFEEEEFEVFIKDTDKNKSIEERLLSLIQLVRIGIYLNNEDYLLVLDFAFGYDSELGFRDDMIVLWLNEKYKVVDIGVEG